MSYNFGKLIRKERDGIKFFSIPIKSQNSLKINNVKLQIYQQLAGRGTVLALFIPNGESKELIYNLDLIAINHVETNNKRWFPNKLTSELIIEFFQPTLSHQGTIHIVVNNELPPSNELEGQPLFIEIIPKELIINQRSFNVVWSLKQIKVNSLDFNDDEIEPLSDDKEYIEDKIKKEFQNIKMRIDENKNVLLESLARLERFEIDITNAKNRIEEEIEASTKWYTAIESYESLKEQFYTGTYK